MQVSKKLIGSIVEDTFGRLGTVVDAHAKKIKIQWSHSQECTTFKSIKYLTDLDLTLIISHQDLLEEFNKGLMNKL